MMGRKPRWLSKQRYDAILFTECTWMEDPPQRPCLRKIQAVPSTTYGMLKFSMQDEVVTLHSSTVVPTECRMVAEAPVELHTNEPTVEAGIKVAIHPEYPKHTVTIGGSLSEKGRMKLCDLLRSNLDIFH
ncbi:hypothetical protein Tco_0821956 [Tanacetum coccineum]|uniref:Uncharacterized protein n=1 Tax=Tanacetum coccineum TaxID=301880 RepID=A0ABQ5AGQ3_9ASTR